MDFFAKNIKYLRIKKGCNQAEMAASIGVTQAAWSEYELGTSKPRFTELEKIKDLFCISYTELLDLNLEKLNPNEILEFRKIIKKLNPNLNLSLNLNDLFNGNPEKAHAPDPALEKKLSAMEYELKEMRRKLGL